MGFYHDTSVSVGSPNVRTWGDKTRGRKCEEEGHGQGFIIKSLFIRLLNSLFSTGLYSLQLVNPLKNLVKSFGISEHLLLWCEFLVSSEIYFENNLEKHAFQSKICFPNQNSPLSQNQKNEKKFGIHTIIAFLHSIHYLLLLVPKSALTLTK